MLDELAKRGRARTRRPPTLEVGEFERPERGERNRVGLVGEGAQIIDYGRATTATISLILAPEPSEFMVSLTALVTLALLSRQRILRSR